MQRYYRSHRATWACGKFCCCLPAALRAAPRELWVVILVKMIGSLAYFSSSLVFVPYMHNEFNYTDVEAGTLYGVWGFLTSVMGVVCGPVIDRLGIKRSLVVGSLFGVAGAVVMSLARSRGWILLAICCLMPLSTSLGIPVLTIGIKRYTSSRNRDLSYGIFYSMMNVGAVVAGPCVDAIRFGVAGGVSYGGYTASAPRVVFLLGGILMLLMALLAVGVIRDVVVTKHGAVYLRVARANPGPLQQAPADDNEIIDQEMLKAELDEDELKPPSRGGCSPRAWLEPLRDRFFWRLATFSFAMTPVNMIFRHMDATLPTWLMRTLGEKVAFGTLYIVDPFCVIILTIVFPLLLSRYDVYKRMIVGSLISSLAVFILAMQASALSVVLFGVALSVGESLYSPLIYSYSMSLAPKDKEGSYTALSSAPLFTTKLFVGWISGSLLGTYCPRDGPTQYCPIVWVWVGGIALLTPVMLLVSMRFVHSAESRIRMASQEDGRKREDAQPGALDIMESQLNEMHDKLTNDGPGKTKK